MKSVHLTFAAMLLASAGGIAMAQPNPFAPPAPPAPTPVAAPAAAPVVAPAPEAPSKPKWEEDVQASRIGTVNGLRVYRGSNTYMFEKAKDVEVVRRLVVPSAKSDSAPALDTPPSAASTSSRAAPSAAPPAAPPKALPSMVGKPAPRK